MEWNTVFKNTGFYLLPISRERSFLVRLSTSIPNTSRSNPSAHGHDGQELGGEEESYDEHLDPSGGGGVGHTAVGEELGEHVHTPY